MSVLMSISGMNTRNAVSEASTGGNQHLEWYEAPEVSHEPDKVGNIGLERHPPDVSSIQRKHRGFRGYRKTAMNMVVSSQRCLSWRLQLSMTLGHAYH